MFISSAEKNSIHQEIEHLHAMFMSLQERYSTMSNEYRDLSIKFVHYKNLVEALGNDIKTHRYRLDIHSKALMSEDSTEIIPIKRKPGRPRKQEVKK